MLAEDVRSPARKSTQRQMVWRAIFQANIKAHTSKLAAKIIIG